MAWWKIRIWIPKGPFGVKNLTKIIQNIYLNWHMFHIMVNCAPDDSWFSMNKDACGIYAFDSAGGEINHHYFPSSAIYRTFPRTFTQFDFPVCPIWPNLGPGKCERDLILSHAESETYWVRARDERKSSTFWVDL